MQPKSISYTAQRFNEQKQALLTFAKAYFPNTHTDFSDESVGTMFVEMMAALGDVQGFYRDTQFQEVLLTDATDLKNLYSLAYQFGYRPKPTRLATTTIDVYQLIPAIGELPDYDYSLQIDGGMQLSSIDSNLPFYVEDAVDFSHSSSYDPTEVVISNRVSGSITEYQLRKQVKAVSGEVKQQVFQINNAEPYHQLELVDESIASILSIVDSDGNKWYEVDYLAQDEVISFLPNNGSVVPNTRQYQIDTPFLIDWVWVPRRFVSRFFDPKTLLIEFGSGTSEGDTSKLINFDKYGLSTLEGNQLVGLDPTRFLRSNAYGLVPQNTTLTVTYLKGGGIQSNVQSGTVTNISFATIGVKNGADINIANSVKDSLAVENPEPASGGKNGDTVDEIRQAALGSYGSQLRAVTADDYRTRVLAMEPKFGSVARCFVQNEGNVIGLYVIGFNSDGNFYPVNSATKLNINRYLEPYKLISDSISIRDAFVINIGVEYSVIVLPGFSTSTVLSTCNSLLSTYFDKSLWDINQPINTSDIFAKLAHLDGVQSISSLKIVNKSGAGYSDYSYDISSATRSSIVYCSQDKMIFELKYPDKDILGKVMNF